MPILGYNFQSPSVSNAAVVGTFGDAEQPCRFAVSELVGLATLTSYRIFSVESYGAVGNGVADDTAAIQAAINAAGTVGGVVMFRSGSTYKLSTQGTVTGDALVTPYCLLVNAANGPIFFWGNGATLRLANGQASNSMILLIRGSSSVKRTQPTVVDALYFDGNSAAQSAWTDFATLLVAYADEVIVQRCRFTDPPWSCMHIFRNSQNCRALFNRYAHGPNANALRVEVPGVLVQGNVFIGDLLIGLRTSLDMSTNNDISVVGEYMIATHNTFIGGFVPLGCTGIRHCIIANNTIRDATNANSAGLKLGHYSAGPGYDGYENLITGNVIHNCRQGIVLDGVAANGAKRNIVTHNQIVFGPGVAMGQGILETNAAGVSDNYIAHNRICVDGGGRTGITPISATTVVENNQITTTNGATAINPGSAIVRRNRGFATENSGTGTIASGSTSIVVSHGLAITPTAQNVGLTPTNNPTNDPGNLWVSNITSSQFTVNCRADPGAGGMTFAWQVVQP